MLQRPSSTQLCSIGSRAARTSGLIMSNAMIAISDVGAPGLGIDVVAATGRDHRQRDGGPVGATLAAGESSVAPSQGDTSQCALSTIVGQADPAIVEETGEVVPAPEHVI